MQTSKMALWGGLTNSCEKKRSEKQRRKRYKHLKAEFQRIARRDKKAFLHDQCKEIEKTTEWERLEISSIKLEIPREYSRKDGLDKGQKSYGPNISRRY